MILRGTYEDEWRRRDCLVDRGGFFFPLVYTVVYDTFCIAMKLGFYGGAKMVTGANYLLEADDPSSSSGSTRILVDCGLHQGSNFCERHNWEPFVYPPESLAAVFVTHAHIDHTGRLPALVKHGFRGVVYSTPPTRDAAELLLADSDHILAQEAEHFKKPVLFTTGDIAALMTQWKAVEYHEPVTVGPFTVTFWNAGHILGSSFIVVEAEGETLVFSGDLGNAPAPLIGDPEHFTGNATYALIESTYGDRVHEDLPERKGILEDVIEDTVKRGGVLMIPAFAMERTQELLFEIENLMEEKRIPKIPVYLDSPLAIKLTEVYRNYDRYLRHGAEGKTGGDKAHLFRFPWLTMTETTEASKAINDVPAPKIVIAGSGMSHGGRILHHEKRYLSDPKSTLFLVGYQAFGSLGRQLLDGAKTVRIFGEDIAVQARVKAVGGYSAHADQPQLLSWIRPMRKTLKKAFVVQGEEPAAQALAGKITDELAVATHIPNLGEEVVL